MLDQTLVYILIAFSVLTFFYITFMIKLSPNNRLGLCILLLFEGLSISFLPSWTSSYFGFILVLISFYFMNILSQEGHFNFTSSANEKSYLINKLEKFRLVQFFQWVGFFIIFNVLIMFPILFEESFGQLDIILICLGFFWLIYRYINPKYSFIRDFTFLFLNYLAIIFLIPTFIFYVFGDSSNTFTVWEEFFVEPFLVNPLSNILNFLGYESFASGINIKFRGVDGSLLQVSIQQSCSGLHSVVIFICAFLAYVDVEIKKYNYDVLFFILFGIILAYISNFLRMLMIIFVGHYRGLDALVWTHEHLGWLFFLIWISLFWNIFANYFVSKETTS